MSDDTTKPTFTQIDAAAERLFEYFEENHFFTWPEHGGDDGYRGDGCWTTIAPTDILIKYREMAEIALFAGMNVKKTLQTVLNDALHDAGVANA